jgi:hypothetical protein
MSTPNISGDYKEFNENFQKDASTSRRP